MRRLTKSVAIVDELSSPLSIPLIHEERLVSAPACRSMISSDIITIVSIGCD
jgi:hypothetical protein